MVGKDILIPGPTLLKTIQCAIAPYYDSRALAQLLQQPRGQRFACAHNTMLLRLDGHQAGAIRCARLTAESALLPMSATTRLFSL